MFLIQVEKIIGGGRIATTYLQVNGDSFVLCCKHLATRFKTEEDAKKVILSPNSLYDREYSIVVMDIIEEKNE